MQTTAALVIIFNHRYDKNIPVLEKLYADRFRYIYFLVPFYDGDKENVIPVYETSFQFQGYLAQGFNRFFKDEFQHYLFIADDLILNPAINETNYKEHFGLTNEASFIPEVHELHNLTNNNTLRFIPADGYGGKSKKLYWWRLKQLIHYSHGSEGVETKAEMPSYEQAEKKLNAHGYHPRSLSFEDVYGALPSLQTKPPKMAVLHFVNDRLRKYQKEFRLPYPVVGSYSDIVIVAKPSVKKFIHYCGVFAANGLFVEFAMPTALLLASDNVVTEPKLPKRGAIYWLYTEPEKKEFDAAMAPFDSNLTKLLQHFPENKLYIHPIKLSKWN